MRGKNPIRPPESGDGTTLNVQHIFATLQGEGPRAGTPAVFIRLGGCNLACTFCDTEFESFKSMLLEEIMKEVRSLAVIASECNERSNPDHKQGWIASSAAPPRNDVKRYLIVITGGEPLRQPIEKLCEALLAEGFTVQIETNGTLWRKLPDAVEIVCSPKNTGNGYFPLRPDLLARVGALKFLISAQRTEYSDVAQMRNDIPVYVQPMDEYDDAKNDANLKLAMELAQQHGYRLSLQLHKILGIE